MAGKDLLLPIERKDILIFGYSNVGDQPRCGQSLGDELKGRRSNLYPWPFTFHALATLTGILLSDVPDYLELGRIDIELLAHLFAGPRKMSAADTDLFLFIEIVDHFYPREILRQRFALGAAAGVFRNDQSLCFSRLLHEGFGFIEQLQLARFRLLRALFTLAPEELPLKKANPLLQKLDPGTVFCVQINNALSLSRSVLPPHVTQRRRCRS
jgi:hypothetical protein